MRRLGFAVLIPCIVLGVLDFAWTAWQQTPRPVRPDAYTSLFFRDYVTVQGPVPPAPLLTYTESAGGDRYAPRWRDFIARPLNTPPEGGTVLLAEMPRLRYGETPPELAPERTAFTGMAVEADEELEAKLAPSFPPGTRLVRLQLYQGAPRLAVSAVLALLPALLLAWVLRLDAWRERGEDARAGYPQKVSRFLFALCLPWPAYMLWLRAWRDPEGDSLGFAVASYLLFFIFFFCSIQRASRKVERVRLAVPPSRWG